MELPRRIQRRASDRLIAWIHGVGNRNATFEETIHGLGRRLLEEGVTVWRLSSSLRAYQPEVAVRNVTWKADGDELNVVEVSPERVASRAYTDSPILASRREQRSLSISLEGDEPQVFPICAELKELGATAYWVHGMPETLGTFISFATRQAGGFTSEELELFEKIMPALDVRVELFCSRWGMQSLMHLYLGANAARRVLDGEFRLGGGHEINAVIWLCDLRGFTSMTESNPIEKVLAHLNEYFSCVVEPIVAQGGEVLKFVGDAVLAVFPVADKPASEVCGRALAAAREAFRSMARINAGRASRDVLHFGVGLHLGRVSYGNIGTPGRLDFTVIGPAVNETARIEALCGPLQRPFLVSKTFSDAACCAELKSLGSHQLKGVSEAREVFTIDSVYEL